jgi:hypothetical protein
MGKGGKRTVYAGLEGLAAHFAVQLSDAQFLLHLYVDGRFRVAEETLELGWEAVGFALCWRFST